MESSKEQTDGPMSLFYQVQRKRRLVDGIEILRQICVEIKKFHDEDRVVGNLNPSDIYIDGQVPIIRKPESISDAEWASYDTENTKEKDIFSLGCLFYFVLSGGQHPFGDSSRRQLMSNNLFQLKACKEIHSRKLIERMIHFKPDKRPRIQEICDHPMFWETNQIVTFLKENSKKIEQLRKTIEIFSAEVLQSSMVAQVKRRKKVDVKSISDILNEIKITDNDSDVLYWHKMFPNLLPAIYLVTEDCQLTNEYHPSTTGILLMASHRFDDLKLERKAKQIKLRPGRFRDQYVNVIVASKSDEDLQHYLAVLNEMLHIRTAKVLPLLFSDVNLDICYFAMKAIELTLGSAINDPRFSHPNSSKSVFHQLAKGLTLLHSKKIVHGTLSPDEVVIEFKSDCEIVAKIAKLTPGQDDWGLPTASEEDDVRRLGCIGYWLLSRDQSHPFGTSELRQRNIEQKNYELKNLSPESYNLIWTMVALQPVPCNAVLFHPFFWSCGKIVNFFRVAQYFSTDTNTSNIAVFSLSHMGDPNSDLGKWFELHSGIPTNSRTALEYFVLWVNDSSEKDHLDSSCEEKWIRDWTEFFPDFLLQVWGTLQKSKTNEDLSSFFYSSFDFPVAEVIPEKITEISRRDVMIKPPSTVDLKQQNDTSKSLKKAIKKAVDAKQRSQDFHQALVMDSESNRTALHLASQSDEYHPLAEQMIKELGVDPNLRDRQGQTPLHIAALYNSLKIAELLIENKAIADILDHRLLTPLYLAVFSNSFIIAKLLLDYLGVNAKDQLGRTVLHISVEIGSIRIIEELLTDPTVDINAQDINGRTALHIAASKNDLRIVELLLKERCSSYKEINSNSIDNDRNSALHIAVVYNATETVVKLLEANVNVNGRNQFGFTPLYLAVRRQSYELVTLLLNRGSNCNIPDQFGNTALHQAVFNGFATAVRLLLEMGCNPNASNAQGLTALQMIQTDSCEIARMLMAHGARSNLVNCDGWSIWHTAVMNKQEKVIDVLLEHQSDLVNMKSENDFSVTALHLAAYFDLEIIAAKLIEKGATVDAHDSNKEIPLFYAAARNSSKVVTLLLPSPTKANVEGLNGRSPLHVAAIKNSINVAKILVDFGGKINSQDQFNLTPLHYASYCNQLLFIDFLLEHRIKKSPRSKPLLPEQLAMLRTSCFFRTIPFVGIEMVHSNVTFKF